MFDKTRKPAIHHATSTRGRGHRMSDRQREAAQAAFLASFALNANITAACKQANIDRSTFYEWTEHDEQFSMRYHQAGEAATDVLLAAARLAHPCIPYQLTGGCRHHHPAQGVCYLRRPGRIQPRAGGHRRVAPGT